ncbi:MAG: sulfatase-like hydrolase/transferase [bacterium]
MKLNPKYVRRLAWTAAIVFMIAAAVQFGACIYSWFYGGFDFHVGPVRLRIHEWVRPWYTGMGFLLAAVLLRPRPFILRRLLPASLAGKSQGEGPDAKSWAWFGGALGSGIGFYAGFAYEYIFWLFAYKLFLAVLIAILFGLLHFLWCSLFSLISKRIDSEYVRGLCWGLYMLLWAGLVVGPLRSWEGRFVDPLWPLFAGFAAFIIISFTAAALLPRLIPRSRKIYATVSVLVVIAALSVSFIKAYRSLHPSKPPRDRVIIITLDTTRADHLSCYGYHRKTSPFIDSLAESGVRFDMAIAPIGLTDPSHASMFTGVYPRTHGCWGRAGFPITGNVASLAEYFRQRGYSTAAIVSRAEFGPSRTMNLPGFDYETVSGRGSNETSAALAFRRAANWLTRHRDENVFIWVHFFDPHKPYTPHPELDTRFSDSDEEQKPESWLSKDEKIDDKTVRTCRNIYDEEILYMDSWVERLVKWVRELEPQTRRPPLLALMGDHGDVLGELQDHKIRFGFGHGVILYNSVLRIPFIINWPGEIKKGATVNEISETIDLAPTIVELVFGKKDFPAQGRSLLCLIKGECNSREDMGFSRRTNVGCLPDRPWLALDGYAVYKESFKLIVRPHQEYELYNMDTDKEEKEDITAKLPEKVDELSKELEAWKKRTPVSEPADKKYSEREHKVFKALGYIQ